MTFHLMYEVLGLDAVHFRTSYLKTIMKLVNDYDAELLSRPGIGSTFGDMSAECFAQGPQGLIDDSELLYRRWEFEVTAIQRPVHIWQGTEDRLVPLPINQRVADETPGAVWHEVEGAGHFVAVGEADDIFAIAAAEWGRSSLLRPRDAVSSSSSTRRRTGELRSRGRSRCSVSRRAV